MTGSSVEVEKHESGASTHVQIENTQSMTSSDRNKLIYCAVGTFVSYFIYGILQESMYVFCNKLTYVWVIQLDPILNLIENLKFILKFIETWDKFYKLMNICLIQASYVFQHKHAFICFFVWRIYYIYFLPILF